MENLLNETPMLNYSQPPIRTLIDKMGWYNTWMYLYLFC